MPKLTALSPWSLFRCARCGRVRAASGTCPEDGEPLAPVDTRGPLSSCSVEGYEVGPLLALSPTSHVYVARHARVDALVTLKVPDVDTGGTVALHGFFDEMFAIMRIRGSLALTVLDRVAVTDAVPGLVRPFVQGRTVATLLDREGPVHILEAVRLMQAAAEAVAEVHRAGLVHGDLTPDHLLVDEGADRVAIRLLGFASAMPNGANSDPLFQRYSASAAAPERLRDGGFLTPATDVYALGALMFSLLSGRDLFVGPSRAAVLAQHRDACPPSVMEVNPRAWIAPPVQALIDRCLAKRARTRPANATVFLRDLERALEALRGSYGGHEHRRSGGRCAAGTASYETRALGGVCEPTRPIRGM